MEWTSEKVSDKELETMYIAMMFEELCNIRNKEIELYIIRRQCQEYPKIMRKKLFFNVDRNALADMKKTTKNTYKKQPPDDGGDKEGNCW